MTQTQKQTMPQDGSDDLVIAKVEDLTLHFDTDRGVVKALDGVEFDLRAAETLALVGETGCGKTITARSFMQLVPTPPGRYEGGRMLLRTEDRCPACGGEGCGDCEFTGRQFEDILARTSDGMQQLRGNRIAMIFQDPEEALNPSLTIREQIGEAILAHRGEDILEAVGVDRANASGLAYRLLSDYCSTKQARLSSLAMRVPPLRRHRAEVRRLIREQSIEILRDTQIPNPAEVIDKYPHELSGGMKQRVMIAMALVARPDLLIADEPTTALDVTTQVKILRLMDSLQEKYDTSLLYITHDLTLVSEIADRVVVMYAGQVAEIGAVDEVFDEPLHPYTRGLLDSIPTEDKLDEELTGIPGSIPDLTNPPSGCRFCTRCPEVMDHCRTEKPPLLEETPGHEVACHLYPDDSTAADGRRSDR